MSESLIQIQRRLADVTAKMEKVEEELAEAQATLAKLREQEPAGYVFGDWRGATTISAVKGSHFNTPLYAEPIPVPAPAVPEDWRKVMAELADDLAIEIDQNYPPERRMYPSEQRRYEGEMEIVNRARALLQSTPQSGSEPQKEYAWECNECGAQEYTMSVGQSIIESGALACGSCGCDEFHKAEVRND
jgi:hypothetical protein